MEQTSRKISIDELSIKPSFQSKKCGERDDEIAHFRKSARPESSGGRAADKLF
jgi:hypothetical protein